MSKPQNPRKLTRPMLDFAGVVAKTEARLEFDPNSGCWLYSGAGDQHGYGHAHLHGRKVKTHRLLFEAYRGPIPNGLHVLHKCDTPACCNPNHLFLGTQVENMADMAKKRRNPMQMRPERSSFNDPANRCGRLGEKHHSAKLTDAEVVALRAARAQGASVKELAARYGINKSSVWKITSGRNRHILTNPQRAMENA